MNEGITVKANIRLLPADDGGRASSIKGSYRPNHNFFDPDNRDRSASSICRMAPICVQATTSICRLRSGNGLASKGQIHQGREWRIQEGDKLVGIGTALDVLPRVDEFTT